MNALHDEHIIVLSISRLVENNVVCIFAIEFHYDVNGRYNNDILAISVCGYNPFSYCCRFAASLRTMTDQAFVDMLF